MRARRAAPEATDREIAVVAAVLVAESEMVAAYHLGLSRSTLKHHLGSARSKVGAKTTAELAWILAPRLPEADRRPPTPMALLGNRPQPEHDPRQG